MGSPDDHMFETPLFRRQLRMEIASWIGRHFMKWRSRIRPKKSPALLDIGAGANFLDGWIHVDFFRTPPIRFWKKAPRARRPEVETDLRYPLDCPSDSIDGVYSGHTLEHLYPREARALLLEIFRVLKPGAWARINVPDLGKYVALYTGRVVHPKFAAFTSGAAAIGSLTQNHGHHSVWDRALLQGVLEEIGFKSVREVAFEKEGSDPRLIKEESIRAWETLVVEGQKPLDVGL